jgi:hypothetical protein
MAFLQDINDGYFPWELHERYPKGCIFNTSDFTKLTFREYLHQELKTGGWGAAGRLGIGGGRAKKKEEWLLNRMPAVKIVNGEIVRMRDEMEALMTKKRQGASRGTAANAPATTLFTADTWHNQDAWPVVIRTAKPLRALALMHRDDEPLIDRNVIRVAPTPAAEAMLKKATEAKKAAEAKKPPSKGAQKGAPAPAPAQLILDGIVPFFFSLFSLLPLIRLSLSFFFAELLGKSAPSSCIPIIVRIVGEHIPTLFCLAPTDPMSTIADILSGKESKGSASSSSSSTSTSSSSPHPTLRLFAPELRHFFDTQNALSVSVSKSHLQPLSVLVAQKV